MNKRFKNCNKS